MNLYQLDIRRSRYLHLHLCLLALALVTAFSGLLVSTPALAQNAGAEMKREYFIRQGADEALLIRISGNEADINSNVYAPERKLLLTSSTNGNRIAPLFQFIDSTGKDRQLDIEVAASQFTANTHFDIGITRLKIWDGRSQALARAYALLSFGMQSTQAQSAAGWSVKINSLLGAADTFDQYGMTELKLWSTWLATWLVQSQLHDNNMALSLIKEIQASTKASQWQEIDLAARQTKSAALVGLMEQGAGTNPESVQEQILDTAALAEKMGQRAIQSELLYQSGLQYAKQSNDASALQVFQQALAIAEDISDPRLVKDIRESMAGIHAEQGDDQATVVVLKQLETQLALEDTGSDELALNLLQQGRILMRIWEYPEAIEVLQQALGFENDSSIAGQINRELALASHEIGQQADALKYLQTAGINKTDAAGYFNSDDQSARLDASGLRRQAEASYQKARSLAQSGKRNEARQELEQLLDQVLFLRQSLPGVLGSWYWQRRDALLDDYLALSAAGQAVANDAAANTIVANNAAALLALSKSRFASKAPLWPTATLELRNLLAQSSANDASAKTGLAKLQDLFAKNFQFLSTAGIQSCLRQLSTDEVVLTYHLSPAGAYVWIADSQRIDMRRLSNPAQIISTLEGGLAQIAGANPSQFDALMSAIGNALVLPVKQELKKTIYLVTSGLMLSLPFDSLRLDRHYLAENYSVVNVLSFPAGTPASQFQRPQPDKVFLAGDPQDFQAEYANRWQPSEPIKTIKDIFVGPGLNIVQGAALLPDEFQSEAFRQSNLVHLSMPGRINLGHPDQSWLQLSEPLRDMGRILLRPDSLRTVPIQADLVYMAASKTEGLPLSPLSQQLGLVSDVLHSGAKTVIVQLWSTTEAATDDFLKTFYAELESTGNVATALADTKRNAINNPRRPDAGTWSSQQMYIK